MHHKVVLPVSCLAEKAIFFPIAALIDRTVCIRYFPSWKTLLYTLPSGMSSSLPRMTSRCAIHLRIPYRLDISSSRYSVASRCAIHLRTHRVTLDYEDLERTLLGDELFRDN